MLIFEYNVYRKEKDNMAKEEKKRVLFLSDLHCGHKGAIASPKWAVNNLQKRLWKFYTEAIDEIKPIDYLVLNGDMLDGSGKINGGVELITTDRSQQIEIAKEVIEYTNVVGKNIFMTFGTAYHTGKEEDWEKVLADKLGAHIDSTLFIDFNAGLTFDIKHHIGSSKVPYSRSNAISREAVWQRLRSSRGFESTADIFIRGHLHYFAIAMDSLLGLRMTLPCLQMESNFGKRICDGHTDVGFVYFDIFNNGNYGYKPALLEPKKRKRPLLKI